MAEPLAQLEREIFTRYLHIAPQASSPNYFQLLGLDATSADVMAVRLAGQLRKDIVSGITDPRLKVAVPSVIAQLDVAMAALIQRAQRQAAERGAGSSHQSKTAPALVPLNQAPALVPINQSPGLVPIESAQLRPLQPLRPIADDPLGLGQLNHADVLGKPVLRPTANTDNDSDSSNQKLLMIAGIGGGGTLLLLLVLMVVTRFLFRTTAVAQAEVPPAVPAVAPEPVTPELPPAIQPAVASVVPVVTETALPPTPPAINSAPVQANVVEAEPEPARPAPMAPVAVPAAVVPPPKIVQPLPKETDLPRATDAKEQSLGTLASTESVKLDIDGGASSNYEWKLQSLTTEVDALAWTAVATPREVDKVNAFSAVDGPVADFIVRDSDLRFRWRPGVNAEVAAQLKNCILEVSTGKTMHGMQLRKPLVVPAMHVRLAQRRERIGLPIHDWPAKEQLFFDVLECRDFHEHPIIDPTDQRVFGKSRGSIKLPGAEKAEITFGLLLDAQPRMASFESRFFIGRGEADLTFDRVDRSILDMQENLLKEQNAMVNAEARLVAAVQESNAIRSAGYPTGLSAQAELLVRSQRLQRLGQEVTKSRLAIGRIQKSIPRLQENIASVQELRATMEHWTKGVIHWRVGAKTKRGEVTLITTMK